MINFFNHDIQLIDRKEMLKFDEFLDASINSCWCSQISNEMRNIREQMGTISNGIHCIIQKAHIDHVHSSEVMTKIMHSMELIADAIGHLRINNHMNGLFFFFFFLLLN